MSLSTLPISYCTNVHAGRTIAEVDAGLDQYTVNVRDACGQPLAAGLWLARSVVTELLESEQVLLGFRDRLRERELECYTLNTFPFGDFHSERVKENVYLPDWTTDERRAYTLDCATVLSALLPDNVDGTMSTVPLGGRMNHRGPDFHRECYAQLIETARGLKQLHSGTGRMVRLAIEPEPCCEISSIPELAVPIFRQLREYAADQDALDVVMEHIGLCFDVCHQAVEFENIPDSIQLLVDNDIRIHKLHISNAIELPDPANNKEGREALVRFVEPRYLHQVYAKEVDGEILNRIDLDEADVLRGEGDYTKFDRAEAWRIHFHVPVNADTMGPLKTTRTELKQAIDSVADLDYAPHLEIETYTWEVLPDGKSVDLVTGLCQEVQGTSELLNVTRDQEVGSN